MKWSLLGIFMMVAAASCNDFVSQESLEGSKVFNVYPSTKKQYLILSELEDNVAGLDYWQRPSILGREARILVPQKSQPAFESILSSVGIAYEVFIEDVRSMIEEEMRVQNVAVNNRAVGERIGFTSFYRHNEINAYLDDLAARYPGKVKVETMGLSGEGRPLKVIKISASNGTDARKPVVLVDSAIHAREWIAPSVALYMITKLVEDITEMDVADKLDWVIVPVLNPDGYEYTFTNARLWRKTRSTIASSTCPGVDGNRNFDYQWGGSGGSSSPCSETFAGSQAFSEPETMFMQGLMLQYKQRTKLYLAIHSHGSYLLYPYGFDGSLPANSAELISVGNEAAAAIKQAAAPGSKNYIVGNSAVALNYKSAGNSQDYATAVAGTNVSYIIELPSGGSAGFDPPPTVIDQVVKETWAGILVIARHILK